MTQSPASNPTFSEPFVPHHPWLAALLVGTIATPAGVVLGWLLPRPLDAIVALPLVLLDIRVGSAPPAGADEPTVPGATLVRLAALLLGIVLTWLFYVLVARLALWRWLAEERKSSRGDGAPEA